MTMINLKSAYQLQKKYLADKPIVAYKVGASNYRSAKIFGCGEILIGGIEENAISYGKVTKNYAIAEVELISKISLKGKSSGEYDLISNYIGVECPDLVVDNQIGSAFISVADSCSAGDLIVYQKLPDNWHSTVEVYVNDQLLTVGSAENLIFSVDKIIRDTISLIHTHNLPIKSNELMIATGGLTDVFSLSLGDKVVLSC